MKVDVSIQSFNKPESVIYTLLSLKKSCGEYIDTIYLDDDCSKKGVVDYYKDEEFLGIMKPLKIKIRINQKKSGFTHTLMTRESFKKQKIIKKIQLVGHLLIRRLVFYKTDNDIRYQWAINTTNKNLLFIIHDDIKFNGNVLKEYLVEIDKDKKCAIVGDLGGSKRCPYGPCRSKKCSPEKIMKGYRPSINWPITGKKSFFHSILGRKNRSCRINEWCCLIRVDIARKLVMEEGTYFGNYEGGGDVGTFWFEKIIKKGYTFSDPFPSIAERSKFYLHWWQGYEGHSVWVNINGQKTADYQKDMIKNKILNEFNYKL